MRHGCLNSLVQASIRRRAAQRALPGASSRVLWRVAAEEGVCVSVSIKCWGIDRVTTQNQGPIGLRPNIRVVETTVISTMARMTVGIQPRVGPPEIRPPTKRKSCYGVGCKYPPAMPAINSNVIPPSSPPGNIRGRHVLVDPQDGHQQLGHPHTSSSGRILFHQTLTLTLFTCP